MHDFLIKICGLTDAIAVDAAVEAEVDMVGLVFFPPSPRHLDLQLAADLADRIAGRSKIVGLFVNPAPEAVQTVAAALPLDIIQLHGTEQPADLQAIRQVFAGRIWKAIGVRERSDLAAANAYHAHCDGILLDAKPPKHASRPGGLGTPFDWSILQGYQPSSPTLLSGGLNVENVAEAVEATRLSGVDVSTGVESSPGRKDPVLIEQFVRRARDAMTMRTN